MFIDIHAHAYRNSPPLPVRFCTPEQVLERYDAAGIERGVLLGRNETLGIDDLPSQLRDGEQRPPLAAALASGLTLRELEREYIKRVLENTAGNKSEAAKLLDITRTTLNNKLKRITSRGD